MFRPQLPPESVHPKALKSKDCEAERGSGKVKIEAHLPPEQVSGSPNHQIHNSERDNNEETFRANAATTAVLCGCAERD